MVQPKAIVSPYSGATVQPKIIERIVGRKIIKEAIWICPTSGEFLKKGTVSVTEKK